jgi:hypothetical protein
VPEAVWKINVNNWAGWADRSVRPTL